ncbi:hypothetical protein ACUV9D_23595, partial [Escherichia coli]|uniref:hypothetical protein n=1 Tax=Escherichia coli TaxID=562 RepID=UPI0040555096
KKLEQCTSGAITKSDLRPDMAMFAPQYNIEINNDGTNGQIGPAALKVVYDLGKKAAADFMQQQARDGGRLPIV